MPSVDSNTIVNIVAMVVAAKTQVTGIRFPRLLLAAGYIRRGSNGSHGPKIKIVNSIHGVIFCCLSSTWA